MRYVRRWPSILLSTVLAACTGDDTGGGSGAGTGGSGASGGGSASATSTTGTSTTAGTSVTAGSSGTGGACDGFGDAFGPTVPVTVTNGTNAPIYLAVDPCDTSVERSVVDGATDEVVPELTDCATCENAVQGSCECPGPPCFLAAGLRLDPGASVSFDVSATTFDTLPVPDACPGAMLCGNMCQQASPLSDGTYLVRVQAATAVDCGGQQPCDCMPDQTGTCLVDMEGGLVDPTSYDGAFDVPNPAPVAIMIQ